MTETCITCGDIELYYVLSCGDAAVGDSVILMFGGEDHDELKAEIDVVQDAFNEISQNAAEDSNEGAEATVQAQDHLALHHVRNPVPDMLWLGRLSLQAGLAALKVLAVPTIERGPWYAQLCQCLMGRQMALFNQPDDLKLLRCRPLGRFGLAKSPAG